MVRFLRSIGLRLTEQGLLALTDQLVDLLPSEVTHGLHVRDGVDRAGQVTL